MQVRTSQKWNKNEDNENEWSIKKMFIISILLFYNGEMFISVELKLTWSL